MELFAKRSERALNHKKTTESQNFSFARIFARILPIFLLKIRPDSARIFTKMSPDEELGTLGVFWVPYCLGRRP